MSSKTSVMVTSTLRAVGVTTLVTSILWTSLAVYNATKRTVDLKIEADILAPINPAINMELVKSLEERRQLSEEASVSAALQEAIRVLLIEPGPEEVVVVETATPAAVPTAEASQAPVIEEPSPEPTL